VVVCLTGCTGTSDTPTSSTPQSSDYSANSTTSQAEPSPVDPIPSPRRAGASAPENSAPKIVVFSPDDFFREMKDNEGTAADKFEGKMIEITGTVGGASRNFLDEPFIKLEVKGELVGVMCFTSMQEPWALFAPGQKVTVIGSVAPANHPLLTKCQIEAVEPNPAVTAKLEDLAEQRLADVDLFGETYRNKWIITSGTITSVDLDQVSPSVFLQSPNEIKVELRFSSSQPDHVMSMLEPGNQIKVVGEWRSYSDDMAIELGECELITGESGKIEQ